MSFEPHQLNTQDNSLEDAIKNLNEKNALITSVLHIAEDGSPGVIAIYLPEHAPEADSLFRHLHRVVCERDHSDQLDTVEVLKLCNEDKLKHIFDWMKAGGFTACSSQRTFYTEGGGEIIVRLLALTGSRNLLAYHYILHTLHTLYA